MTSSNAAAVQALLLWCRENRFRVRNLGVGDVRIAVEDLGDELAPARKPDPEPSVHARFAKELGLPYHEVDEDFEEDGPDPVER